MIWDPSRHWPALAMVDLAEAGSGVLTELAMRREGQLAPLLHVEHVELTLDGRALSVLLLRTLPHHAASLRLALSLMRQADRLVVMGGSDKDLDWQNQLARALGSEGWQGPVWQIATPLEHPTREARLRRHAWPGGVRAQPFGWPRAGRPGWNLDLLRRVMLEPIGLSVVPASPHPPSPPDREPRVSRPKPQRLNRLVSIPSGAPASPLSSSEAARPAEAPAAQQTAPQKPALPPLGEPDRLHHVACDQLIAVPGVRACAVLRLADASLLAQRGDADWLASGATQTRRVAQGWRPDGHDAASSQENEPADVLSWTEDQRQHLLLRLPDDGRGLALLALGDAGTTDPAELRWMATVARNTLAPA
ncbi:hypothetical protein ACWA7J_06725 [Leptothrix sp. BB-4]